MQQYAPHQQYAIYIKMNSAYSRNRQKAGRMHASRRLPAKIDVRFTLTPLDGLPDGRRPSTLARNRVAYPCLEAMMMLSSSRHLLVFNRVRKKSGITHTQERRVPRYTRRE